MFTVNYMTLSMFGLISFMNSLWIYVMVIVVMKSINSMMDTITVIEWIIVSSCSVTVSIVVSMVSKIMTMIPLAVAIVTVVVTISLMVVTISLMVAIVTVVVVFSMITIIM